MCVILHFKTGTTFILHIEAEDNKRKGRLVFLFFFNNQWTTDLLRQMLTTLGTCDPSPLCLFTLCTQFSI